MKAVIIVQARMGSTRLPGKVMKKVLDKPLLGYVIDALKRCEKADALVIATTENPDDDVIAHFCKTQKVSCFRGSEQDVLSRYYLCAKEHQADAVIRVTSDCPLVDPVVIDSMVAIYRRAYPEIDYISNTRVRTFPRGMDGEVFSFAALEAAYTEAKEPYMREHVTPFIYFNEKRFKIANYVSALGNYSDYRLTVDEIADFRLIKKILEELVPEKKNFGLKEVIRLLEEYPEWLKINAEVAQKEVVQAIKEAKKR